MNKKVALGDLACEIAERESNPAASRFERFIGLEHYISGNVEITNYGSTKNIDSAMKIFHSGDILVARRNVYPAAPQWAPQTIHRLAREDLYIKYQRKGG